MKGDYNDECNRTACSNGRATYYNSATHKHYCPSCANTINYWSKIDEGTILCIDQKPVDTIKGRTLKTRDLKKYVHSIKGQVVYNNVIHECELIGIEDNNSIKIYGKYGEEIIPISRFKPILRPLHQINEEITVDDKTFTPRDVICDQIRSSDGILEGFEYLGVDEHNSPRLRYHELISGALVLPYYIIEMLVEWGFDIHGLIPKDLAVSITGTSILETSKGVFELTPLDQLQAKTLLSKNQQTIFISEDMDESTMRSVVDESIEGDLIIYKMYVKGGYSYFDIRVSLRESFFSLISLMGYKKMENPILIKIK